MLLQSLLLGHQENIQKNLLRAILKHAHSLSPHQPTTVHTFNSCANNYRAAESELKITCQCTKGAVRSQLGVTHICEVLEHQ